MRAKVDVSYHALVATDHRPAVCLRVVQSQRECGACGNTSGLLSLPNEMLVRDVPPVLCVCRRYHAVQKPLHAQWGEPLPLLMPTSLVRMCVVNTKGADFAEGVRWCVRAGADLDHVVLCSVTVDKLGYETLCCYTTDTRRWWLSPCIRVQTQV